MKIYVASSWRNNIQPHVVDILRECGHKVYDFKHPADGDNGFHWSEIDKDWKNWNAEKYRDMLSHPIARIGYAKDFLAMKWAECCVLVLPSGASSHLEAGYFVGAGKPLYIFKTEGEPELMYKMATKILISLNELKLEFYR